MEMSVINAAIFDIDGTLLLNEAHARAYFEAASIVGLTVDFTQIRNLIRKGGDKLIPEAFGVEQNSLGKEFDQLKGKIFKTRYLPGCKQRVERGPCSALVSGWLSQLPGIGLVPNHSLTARE
jgi:phosphoglycolate phosphatase-like HAD superfamily hydrolase